MSIKTFIQKNILSITVQVAGLVVVTLNIWLTTKLIPISQSLYGLEFRVGAIELRNSNTDPLVQRFLIIEQHVSDIDKRTSRIENKLDRILE